MVPASQVRPAAVVPRPGWLTGRRRLAAALLLVLAAASILAWGPIGLGNGPLSAASNGTEGGPDPGRQPLAVFIPLSNAGHSPAVLQSIQLIGDAAGYPGPQVFATRALAFAAPHCFGAYPVKRIRPRLIVPVCSMTDLRPLSGASVPFSTGPHLLVEAMAEVRPPARGGCWVLTTVVVHYRVGIRRYAASGPDQVVVCGPAAGSRVNAAMRAAENTG